MDRMKHILKEALKELQGEFELEFPGWSATNIQLEIDGKWLITEMTSTGPFIKPFKIHLTLKKGALTKQVSLREYEGDLRIIDEVIKYE